VIGQHLGAERAGQHARQVDDPKAGQRTTREIGAGHDAQPRLGNSTMPVPRIDSSPSC